MIRVVAILMLLTSAFLLKAQTEETGNLTVYSDSRIEELVQLHVNYNEEFPILEGYRIQVFMDSGNDALVNAQEVEKKFEEKYKDVSAYIIFREPYYRVRVGDFRTRLEAEKFFNRINRAYPNAWVTLDIINLPKMPNQKKTKAYE